MAEPNPHIVKSRPSVPAGDDLATFDLGSVPALPDSDDLQQLSSLAKNAPVSSGADDNFDVNPAVQGPRDPSAGYKSPSPGMPIPLS